MDKPSTPRIPKSPSALSGRERRKNPRAKIEQPVRIRGDRFDSPPELHRTRDISRTGFFFATGSNQYYVGMHLHVILGYQPGDPVTRESLAEVVRIEKLPVGLFGVAVHIVLR